MCFRFVVLYFEKVFTDNILFRKRTSCKNISNHTNTHSVTLHLPGNFYKQKPSSFFFFFLSAQFVCRLCLLGSVSRVQIKYSLNSESPFNMLFSLGICVSETSIIYLNPMRYKPGYIRST